MKIILMRHGQAEGYRHPDSNRQLTKFGKQQADETANYILQHYSPDLYAVSPYDRARQTLESYTALTPDVPIKVINNITPNDKSSEGLDTLYQLQVDCLLVVCHMPIVANMTGLLLNQWATAYSLAEARVIECEVIAENLGTQIDAYVPKQP